MKRLFCVCLLLLTCLLLGGCDSDATPATVLQAVTEAEKPLPAGRLYLLSAPSEDPRHPSEGLLSATFGNGKLPPEMSEVEDAAFYLSVTAPCELAVFLCKSTDGADAVAKMCLRRADLLMRDPTNGGKGVAAESVAVTVRGKWVIFCVSSDPAAACRAFRQAL